MQIYSIVRDAMLHGYLARIPSMEQSRYVKSVDEQNAALMEAFDFTHEDLTANQRGQLSARQVQQEQARRARLIESSRVGATATPIVPLFYLAILIIVGATIYFTGAFQTLQTILGDALLPALGILALLVVLYLLFVLFSWQRGLKRTRELGDLARPLPTVQSATGNVKTGVHRGDDESYTRDTYYLRIERVELGIGKNQLKAFQKGMRYRVYYAVDGRWRKFLSAEVVGE